MINPFWLSNDTQHSCVYCNYLDYVGLILVVLLVSLINYLWFQLSITYTITKPECLALGDKYIDNYLGLVLHN